MSQIRKQIGDLVAALTDPIIVFDPSWEIPEWLFGEIKLQRLTQLIKTEEGIATDAEALAYVSNASLAQPLASEWVAIYQYLLTRLMKDKVPRELRKESLSDYEMEELNRLKQWIWDKRTKARRQRGKEERARAREEAKAKGPVQLGLGL